MMATVPHVTSGLGLRKFQADRFLLTRVYNSFVFAFRRVHIQVDRQNRLSVSSFLPFVCRSVRPPYQFDSH